MKPITSRMATGSFKPASASSVRATRRFRLEPRSTEKIAALSVVATIEPSRRPSRTLRPRNQCAASPVMPAVMSVPAALLTTGVANLATLVPAAPGYVGTFEAGVTLAVTGALGVSRGLALSYAILVHAVLWFPITAAGAFVWWRLHLSVRQARQYDDETEGRAAPVKPRPARPRVDE